MSQARSTREETRKRILDAAEELFATHNPTQVTVREIADKAGVTHALVHQYVGTKDDLLNAVIVRAAPHRQRIIAEKPEYRAVMPVLFNDVLERRVHSRMQVRSAMDGVDYLTLSEPIGTGRILTELAKQSAAQGEVRVPHDDAMDPRIVCAAFTAMAYGWAATEDWLMEVFELQDLGHEQVRAQLLEMASYVAERIYPAEGGAAAAE